MRTTQLLLCALMGVAGLTACGGSSSDSPAPVIVEVPVSAAETPTAYTQFVQEQIAQAPSIADMASPLSLDTIAAVPVSESDDPVTLD